MTNFTHLSKRVRSDNESSYTHSKFSVRKILKLCEMHPKQIFIQTNFILCPFATSTHYKKNSKNNNNVEPKIAKKAYITKFSCLRI